MPDAACHVPAPRASAAGALLRRVRRRRPRPALEKPTASDDGRRRCCIAGAAAYTDTGLLLARDCLVEWYAAFGVAVTLSASATELRSCVDEDRDGVATDSELSRLVGCAQFPDADLPSIVTIESRRDLLRGC